MSIRKQYDTDLESLKESLTEMGRSSADAVENVLEALCVADADAAAAHFGQRFFQRFPIGVVLFTDTHSCFLLYPTRPEM